MSYSVLITGQRQDGWTTESTWWPGITGHLGPSRDNCFIFRIVCKVHVEHLFSKKCHFPFRLQYSYIFSVHIVYKSLLIQLYLWWCITFVSTKWYISFQQFPLCLIYLSNIMEGYIIFLWHTSLLISKIQFGVALPLIISFQCNGYVSQIEFCSLVSCNNHFFI